MPRIKIKEITATEPNAFNDLTKTTFVREDAQEPVYIFTKAGNEPKVGDELEGDVTRDKRSALKFKKSQSQQPPSNGHNNTHATLRQYKADPDKQDSIEWQKALGEARQTLRDFYELRHEHPATLDSYTTDISRLTIRYAALISLRPDGIEEATEDEGEDKPPVDQLQAPAEEEDVLNVDEIPF